ncbi:MAG: lipoxygenase family protein [Nitrospira sp.]|nr:lipoxygenase family protein [Nitrospira sp.]
MSLMTTLQWTIRKGFWNFVAKRKYRRNIPMVVDHPHRTPARLQLIPLVQVYPSIPISDIWIADHPLQDEGRAKRGMLRRLLTRLYPKFFPEELVLRVLAWLYTTTCGPMQPGRPEIPADPYVALDQAYTKGHRRTVIHTSAALTLDPKRTLKPPTLPPELEQFPDLGMLALRGPYAGYLKKVKGSRAQYEWDLRELSSYESYPDLYEPWAHVLFQFHEQDASLKPCRIECQLGTIVPDDPEWPLASRIAVCAATTHTALVRHWTWTHLVGGELFAFATRTKLSDSHPLYRLLWPHLVGTQASNRLATLGQLVPGGDFEAVYSLTYKGLCHLISKSTATFRLGSFDPREDRHHRDMGGRVPTPTLDNCKRLFRIMQAHAYRYFRLYYTDEAIRYDEQIQDWVGELDRLLPNGLGLPPVKLGCASLANVVAKLMYMECVHHEQVGTHCWNYQLWAHTHPVRVYRDNRRVPEDVYQRLVNTNYILNIVRTPLLSDLTNLALEGERMEEAERVFRVFTDRLRAVEHAMEQEPWASWKIYPVQLEVSINA